MNRLPDLTPAELRAMLTAVEVRLGGVGDTFPQEHEALESVHAKLAMALSDGAGVAA